jgi:hypothetical protein
MSSKLSVIFEELLSGYMKIVATKYGIPLKELQELSIPGYDENRGGVGKTHVMDDYSKMTVSDLKKVCSTLGIKKQSTKAKLLQAIQEYHQSTTTSSVENVKSSNSVHLNPIADEDVLIIQDKKKQVGVVFTGEDVEDNGSEMSSSFDDSFILDDDDDDDVADLMDGL